MTQKQLKRDDLYIRATENTCRTYNFAFFEVYLRKANIYEWQCFSSFIKARLDLLIQVIKTVMRWHIPREVKFYLIKRFSSSRVFTNISNRFSFREPTKRKLCKTWSGLSVRSETFRAFVAGKTGCAIENCEQVHCSSACHNCSALFFANFHRLPKFFKFGTIEWKNRQGYLFALGTSRRLWMPFETDIIKLKLFSVSIFSRILSEIMFVKGVRIALVDIRTQTMPHPLIINQ
jgi:hypothetical protein